MKCNYCGFESETNFIFCPSCGKEAPVEYSDEPGSVNPAESVVLNALKDKLFFVICILLTVGSVGALLSGEINVITILATIFAWLVYNCATKNYADVKNLRRLSCTVYAQYIIINVVSIIMVVCGGLFAVLFSAMVSASLFVEDYLYEFQEEIFDLFGSINIAGAFGAAASTFITIIFIAVAVILFLFNFFGMRNVHRFVKSVYQSVENRFIAFDKCKTARIWLMVLGILGAVSALSALDAASLLSFCSSAAIATAEILGSILIKNHFPESEQ